MINISKKGLEIILNNDSRIESISLNSNPQISKLLSEDLALRNFIDSFMAFYLIGDNPYKYLNEDIRLNFPIEPIYFQWFENLFSFWNIDMPNITYEKKDFGKIKLENQKGKDLLAFSGGKDSFFIAKNEDVIPIHIQGMNPRFESRELKAVRELGKLTKNRPQIISLNNLNNIDGNNGYQVRDGLIYVLISMYSLIIGGKNILSGSYEEDSWYCESQQSIEHLNSIFNEKGLENKIKVIDKLSEEEVINELLKTPEVFNYTTSCVISGEDREYLKKKYLTEFTGIPLINDDSCGLCGKCAQINLVKMLHPIESKKLKKNAIVPLVRYYIERYEVSDAFKVLVEADVIRKVSKRYL
ncbi:MAG: hypothetical protein ACMXX8_00355 [Candidatus Woesearchaeota archaeon]